MGALTKRQEMIDFIKRVDESNLDVIYSRWKEDQRIVGYRPNGAPMTLLELEGRLEKSEEQLHTGKFTNVEDLIKKHA